MKAFRALLLFTCATAIRCTTLLGDDFEVTPVIHCAGGCPTADGRCDHSLNTVDNCGACGISCENPNGETRCEHGTCVPVCAPGFDDCDGNPNNGCEADLSSNASHCGACNAACTFPNASGRCMRMRCELGTCNSGFADCNEVSSDGCEVALTSDIRHCGACNAACTNDHGTVTCVMARCSPICAQGFADCDGNSSNGCETNTRSNALHCGGCNEAVDADEVCSNGMRVKESACPVTHRDCNEDLLADGCETDVRSNRYHCGDCGNACTAGTFCSAGRCRPCQHFFEGFANNEAGWQLTGGWQIGPAVGGGGGSCMTPASACGPPDPSLDHTPTDDNGIAGVVLGGNYSTSSAGPFYLTSPSIDLRNTGALWLEFWRWLNSDYAPFVHNTVEIFAGTGWSTLWASPLGTTEQMTATSWTKFTYDLTPHLPTDPALRVGIRLRFGFAVGRSGAFLLSGWNVDDVAIVAADCTP